MAERRMFARTVVNSDIFLDMPAATRALYFHLGMEADDDGFLNNPKGLVRYFGASQDDLKMLISKGFVIPFESGAIVIRHWKQSNYIQKDRYRPTKCTEEMNRLTVLNGVYSMDTERIQSVSVMDTQDRIGKDRIGKDRIETGECEGEGAPSGADARPPIDYQEIVDDYNKTCTSLPKCTKLSDARRKAIAARLRSYTREEIHRAFELAQESEFMTGRNDRDWTASLDWIMKDTNMAKILDGNYSNRKGRENDAGNQFAECFSKYTI